MEVHKWGMAQLGRAWFAGGVRGANTVIATKEQIQLG